MIGFTVLVLIALSVVVIVAVSRSKKEKPIQVDDRPFYRPGSYRGELGSPGTSPKVVGRHSANCECSICLYGHDPDNGSCPCRWCEGYRRGKPLH